MFDRIKYHNKKWLKNRYIKEKLSTLKIAKLCDVGDEAIRVWMIKLGIPRCSYSEACHIRRGNHCSLSRKAIKWINGELLGDGSLNSQSIYSARFTYSSKYREYAQYVSNTLNSFGIEQVGKIVEKYHKSMDCYTYHYYSRMYESLLIVYKQWYPGSKKIVPKDIKLTSLTCRQWYIGDGSLLKYRKNPCIQLHTNGFIISNVKWLVRELNNLGIKATRQPALNIITISVHSTKRFLDYIGKCPIECYQYKWDY